MEMCVYVCATEIIIALPLLQVMVTIEVVGANDHAPVFTEMSYMGNVIEYNDKKPAMPPENIEPNTPLTVTPIIQASDVDGDSLTYSITGGNDLGIFAILDDTVGVRTARGRLDLGQ